MSVPIRDFLTNRRNRALGSILGHAEREIFPQLSEAKQEVFRTLVRDAINSYHDSVLDLVKAEDGVRNEEVVAALERLERSVRSSKPMATVSNGR